MLIIIRDSLTRRHQCDQMLEQKSCPTDSKSCLKNNIHTSFLLKFIFLKWSQESLIFFGQLLLPDMLRITRKNRPIWSHSLAFKRAFSCAKPFCKMTTTFVHLLCKLLLAVFDIRLSKLHFYWQFLTTIYPRNKQTNSSKNLSIPTLDLSLGRIVLCLNEQRADLGLAPQ